MTEVCVLTGASRWYIPDFIYAHLACSCYQSHSPIDLGMSPHFHSIQSIHKYINPTYKHVISPSHELLTASGNWQPTQTHNNRFFVFRNILKSTLEVNKSMTEKKQHGHLLNILDILLFCELNEK